MMSEKEGAMKPPENSAASAGREDSTRTGQIQCIICPLGCTITVTEYRDSPGEIRYRVEEYKCPRGMEYAIGEFTDPKRLLTSTVKTVFPDFPRLPVKTSRPVPKDDLFRYMGIIDSVLVERRLRSGDTVLASMEIPDTVRDGAEVISLIATDDMTGVIKRRSRV